MDVVYVQYDKVMDIIELVNKIVMFDECNCLIIILDGFVGLNLVIDGGIIIVGNVSQLLDGVFVSVMMLVKEV